VEPIPAQGITIQEESGVHIVRIAQDLDNYGASDLEKELNSLMKARNNKLVLDLSKTNYANSTSVGVLIGAAKQARGKGGDVKVFGLSDKLRKTFDLLGASKVLEIFDSESSAVSSF
jgi:anti-sigma B factor antagonist